MEDLYEAKKEKKDGTYAGVHFSEATQTALKDYISDNEIPKPVPGNKLHTTVLYSRKHLPDYKPQGDIEPPYVGTPDGFEVWKTQPDDDGNTSNCLILKFKCPKLVDRHNALMKEHDATFDFDEYKTHVTLSYDIGDTDIKKLPPFEGKLELANEYAETLNVDWAKSNTEKDK